MMQKFKTTFFHLGLIALALFLASCSSIMRPPPAAAYMDSYKRDQAINNIAFSYYAGQLDNGYHEHTSDSHTSHAEWWGDATFARYISGSYFTFGWGLQSLTPFLQAGFVSPYVGLTGWTGTYSLFFAPLSKSDDKMAITFHEMAENVITFTRTDIKLNKCPSRAPNSTQKRAEVFTFLAPLMKIAKCLWSSAMAEI